jgi:signal transduction histidine kinase
MRNIREMGDEIQDYDSLKVPYYHREYVMIYYKNSQIYGEFRNMIDNLLESFFQETVINSASVPVIITDSTQINVIAAGNIDSTIINAPFKVNAQLEKMREENDPIVLDWLDHGKCYVFYEESTVLKQLRLFPYIQYGIIFVFILIAYLLFSVSRRSEENRVWVGMSKETAHQLGTPISSLMAWTELLKEMPIDASIPQEIGKDVHRLETIAQRFSKIGSTPVLEETDIVPIIEDFTNYLQTRISSMVKIHFEKPDHPVILPLNKQLFEWVIENLCKNSADAMNGKGDITINISEEKNKVYIDVTDTGKGIPPKMQRRIFSPGYTSKSRGWGLGLTLARRIIHNYHRGKLFVKSSVIDQGTTMRIQMKKSR